MDFLSNAETTLQSQLELLFDTGWIEVLLEDEQVAVLVEDDKLTVAQRNNTINPKTDVCAGRLNYFNFSLSAVFQLKSADASPCHISDDERFR